MIAKLRDLRTNEGVSVLVRGIVSYGDREEARVTFFAQGRAENCADADYFHTNAYNGIVDTDVSI